MMFIFVCIPICYFHSCFFSLDSRVHPHTNVRSYPLCHISRSPIASSKIFHIYSTCSLLMFWFPPYFRSRFFVVQSFRWIPRTFSILLTCFAHGFLHFNSAVTGVWSLTVSTSNVCNSQHLLIPQALFLLPYGQSGSGFVLVSFPAVNLINFLSFSLLMFAMFTNVRFIYLFFTQFRVKISWNYLDLSKDSLVPSVYFLKTVIFLLYFYPLSVRAHTHFVRCWGKFYDLFVHFLVDQTRKSVPSTPASVLVKNSYIPILVTLFPSRFVFCTPNTSNL